jgi:hypothetical protein
MRKTLLVVALLSTIFVLGAPGPVSAANNVFTVTTTTDGARVHGSLRWALTQVEGVHGGLSRVVLQPGQAYVLNRCNALSEDVGVTGDLDVALDSALTITGNDATIRQTCAGERVLHLTGPHGVALDDLTITGGDAEPDANQPDAQGGGVLGTEITVRTSVVEGNAATGSGGGVKADRLSLAQSVVRDNTSGLNGGAAAVTGNTNINESIVTGNTAAEGGGIAGGVGFLNLFESIVGDNVETTPGAGTADGVDLDIFSGTISMVFSTIRGGDGDGPAVRGNATLTSSVVSQGQADAACGPGPDVSAGHNVDDDGSCNLDETTDQPNVADVGLRADFVPLGTSVLRDHVTTCPNFVDIRHRFRPQGPGCEIGAIELDHHPDGQLRLVGTAATFVGDDVFNAAGVNQTVTARVGANGAKVELRVQNDGDLRDQSLVRGPGNNARFTVRYLRGTTDITAQVVAGTFSTPQLDPGRRSAVITMLIGRRPSTPALATRNLLVTFASSLDADRRDAVLVKAQRA